MISELEQDTQDGRPADLNLGVESGGWTARYARKLPRRLRYRKCPSSPNFAQKQTVHYRGEFRAPQAYESPRRTNLRSTNEAMGI